RPGVLTVAEQDLAGDDGGTEAVGALVESTCTAGQVVDERGHRGADGRRVEDVDVGDQTLAQQAAVRETPRARRRQRDHPHCLLEGEVLAVPHPVGEEVSLDGAVGDLADVAPESENVITVRGWRMALRSAA